MALDFEAAARRLKEADLEAALTAGTKSNPDTEAKLQGMAERMKLPVSAVSAHEAAVAAADRMRAFNSEQSVAENPKLSQWMSDPKNAAVAHDDWDSLSRTEKMLTYGTTLLPSIMLGTVAARLANNPAKAPQRIRDYGGAVLSGAPQFAGGSLSGTAELYGVAVNTLDRGLTALLPESISKGIHEMPSLPWWADPQQILERPGEVIKEGARALAPPQERQNIGTMAAQGVGQLSGQIALSFVAPWLTIPAFYAQGADIMADQTARDLTPEQKDFTGSNWQRDAAIVTSGMITAATERWGLDKILNRVPPAVKNRALRFLADTLIAGGQEALQETAENLGQNLTQQIATNPDVKLLQGISAQASSAAISAAIVRAMLGVKGYRQAQLTENFIKAVGEDSKNSKLRERLPERYRELVDHYQKDGAVKQVMIPADRFVEYFQAQGIDIAAASELTGAKNVTEALAAGSDVVIPMADFVTKVAPSDHLQGLVQDIRLQQHEMTPREAAEAETHAKEVEKQINEAIAAAQKEGASVDEAVQRVIGEVEAQLTERYDKKTAATMAQVMRGVAVLASRNEPGRDPLEAAMALWDTYGLFINPTADMGAAPAAGTTLDQGHFEVTHNGETAKIEMKAQPDGRYAWEVTMPNGQSLATFEHVEQAARAAQKELGWPISLFQNAYGPLWRSALTDAIHNSKVSKGTGQQWLGTLRNTPGIKAEELAWTNTEAWLSEQEGQVTKQQLLDYLAAHEVKVEEVLKGKRPVDQEREYEYIDAQRELIATDNFRGQHYVDLTEHQQRWVNERITPMDEAKESTKFESWQLPGGENYRELLLTLPGSGRTARLREIKTRLGMSREEGVTDDEYRALMDEEKRLLASPQEFRGGHYDEPNVLAHVRFNDRTDADGKRVLFVEEIQSDWHQKGRKEGYQHEAEIDTSGWSVKPRFMSNRKGETPWVFDQTGNPIIEAQGLSEKDAIELGRKAMADKARTSGVPDAPFKTSWPELALKRMIRWAAENGYDRIAWTPGEVQADRYDLSKQIDKLSWDGSRVWAWKKNDSSPVIAQDATAEQLPDIVGKEIAQRLIDAPLVDDGRRLGKYRTLEGLDLKVGGEGMKGFYDKILVDAANKLGKRFGARVGTTKIDIGDKRPMSYRYENPMETFGPQGTVLKSVHSLDITPAMRESVIQGMTLFQGPRTDWLTIQSSVNPNEPMNPLAPFVALEGIQGAQGRLTRAVERQDTVGAPDNQRTELRNDAGDVFVVGKITTQDWWARVLRNLSPAEITAARAWYGDLHRLMGQFFGEQDASRYALAWLLSQQNESPSGGMRNVLRAADMVAGKPEIKKAGLAQKKLLETLRGQLPKEGYDAKLLDFIDSELRRSTRTVMGDDARGGQPAVIDVWANRDVGKIDNRVLQYIAKTFGEEAAAGLQMDGEGIGETDYEYGSKFYNQVSSDLNRASIDGGNWLPLEVQAVGWTAMQKQMGAVPEFPGDIFSKNTQRISIGLQTGAGTEFAGKGEIDEQTAWRIANHAAQLVGVKIIRGQSALGAYLGDTEGSFQIDVLGSPEGLKDFAAVVGHALQQTEVLVSRPLKSGGTQGFTLRQVNDSSLADPAEAERFMASVREKLQERMIAHDEAHLDSAWNTLARKKAGLKPKAWAALTPAERTKLRGDQGRDIPAGQGYQLIIVKGQPALRMFHSTEENKVVKWTGNWSEADSDEVFNVVDEVAKEFKVHVEHHSDQYEVHSERNDWRTDKAGEAFRNSLASRGRDVLAGKLGNSELRLLPNEVGPAGKRQVSHLLGQSIPEEFFQENRGSLQIAPDRKMRISLFESADLSTFLHETGHFYLEVLGDLAESPAAPQQIKDDYAAILKWLGVKDRASIEVKHHEKWARANEAYLMEGKAPAPELRGTFQRFRAWLKLIYKQVSSLGVNMSDDVRGVFDRIYATDAEIARAEAEAQLESLFIDAKTAGMTDEEFALYRQSVEDQSADAKEALQSKLMRIEKLKREAWWKEERAKVADQLAADYDQSQVVQTFERLTGPESTDKLNAGQLVATFGEDILRRLPRGFGKGATAAYAEDGQDIDAIAEVMGYNSADDMVQSLLAMPNRRKFITERSDALMQERHGDLLNSVEIADAAMEAIHGDQREKVLKIELRALARKVREVGPFVKAERDKAKADAQQARAATDMPPVQAFRRIAEGMIGQKQVRDINPNSHLLAERKASREAFKAMAKGDYVEAQRLKQQELLNHYLYLEAIKAKAEATKVGLYMRGFEKLSTREKLAKAGADYLDQIDAILERYEFKKVSLRAIGRREALASWLEQQEAAGAMVSVPESVQDESRRVNYQQLTMDELRAVRDAVKNIAHLANLKNKLIRKGKQIEFDGVREELLTALQESGLTSTGDLGRPSMKGESLKNRAAAAWRQFDAAHLKVEQLVAWLDGGKINGPWARYVFDLADEAQTKEYDLHAKLTTSLQSLVESMPKSWRHNLMDSTDVRVPNFDKPLSRYDLISIALNLGNAQNIQRMTDGYGWSEQNFADIRNALTAEDWAFVQGTWDTLELLWPEMAAMEERTSGLPPEKVKAQEFDAAGTTWRGGYYPLAYDPRFSSAGEKQAVASESVQNFMAQGYGRASTNRGATKQRLAKVKARPLLDFEQVVSSHLAKVIKDISHREAVLGVNKILTDPAIKQALIDRVGEAQYQNLNRWLQTLVNDRANSIHQASGLGKFVMATRTNMAIVTMGWKITTSLSQIAGFGPSMDLVPAKFLGTAMIQASRHPAETWAMITEKSGEMRNRANTIDRDMRDALIRMEGKRGVRHDVQRTAFYLTALADRVVCIPTWLGAYNHALAQGMSEEDAVRAGDRAVRLSQGGGGSKDLAAVQSSNELMKLLTMYYTPFNVLYARLRDTGHQSATQGVGYLPKAAARLLALVILPAVLGELLVMRGPDDDEDAVWWAIRKSLLYPLASIPVLRDMAGYLEASMIRVAGEGEMKYAPSFKLSPVATAFEKMARAAGKLPELVTGEADARDAWDIFEASGYVLGLPTAQVRITGEYLINLLNGEAEVDNVQQILRDALFRRPKQ